MAHTLEAVFRDDVVTVRPDTLARDAAETMREAGVGSVVVEENRHPLGVLTDRDLTVRVLADGQDGTETYAREVMTGTPATVRDDASVFEAARTMHEEAVRRLPVVDGAGTLVGLVALDDIHQYLVDEQEHLTGVVAAESPG
ncbi:CBS domain-containing protein [Haloplanus sp. GCM10025708]|uniref:CBS domain-containing protein n=1 Tax=Haloferacaceae TaxID=1644056 RepID=UPI003621CE82